MAEDQEIGRRAGNVTAKSLPSTKAPDHTRSAESDLTKRDKTGQFLGESFITRPMGQAGTVVFSDIQCWSLCEHGEQIVLCVVYDSCLL